MQLDDINRFLTAHGANTPCTTCGSAELTYCEPQENILWSLSGRQTPGTPVTGVHFFPAIVLMCEKCFTLRTHGLLAMKAWLDMQSEGGNGPV